MRRRDRVFDQRLVGVSDIAGKDQGFGVTLRFGNSDRDGRTAQQMADIGKADFNFAAVILEQGLPAAVGAGHKLCHDLFGIFHRVVRFHHGSTAALGFAVFPFGFLFLNMGRVPQHNAAQVHRGIGGIDGPPIPVFVQVRDLP